MKQATAMMFAVILSVVGFAWPAAAAGVSAADIQAVCPTCTLSGTAQTYEVCPSSGVSKGAPSPGDMFGALAGGENCIARNYGRGVGTVPTCAAGLEKSALGLDCFPKCPSGYSRADFLCWQDCPANFRNDGAFCFKPGNYQRDKYVWKLGDNVGSLDEARARCRADHPAVGCEKQGQIIYQNCKSGEVQIGLDWCGRSCPAKMTDIGISCRKDTIDQARDKTAASTCEKGKELFFPKGIDRGLCYTKCLKGWKGSGPMCNYED
jgi:hypothetical protein